MIALRREVRNGRRSDYPAFTVFGPDQRSLPYPGEPSPHGTRARYELGCDCPVCMDAANHTRIIARGGTVLLRVHCDRHDRYTHLTPDEVRAGAVPQCKACKDAVRKRTTAA